MSSSNHYAAVTHLKSANVRPPSARPDVEGRVAQRKRQLIGELIEHKMSSRIGATYEIGRLHARLADLAHIVKHDVADGWARMSPNATRKVEEWIAR